MQASGIWLLGKIAEYATPGVMAAPPIAVMAAWHPERWSSAYVSFKFPPNWLSEEKSETIWPFSVGLAGSGRSIAVGTVTAGDCFPSLIRRPSWEAKKKV